LKNRLPFDGELYLVRQLYSQSQADDFFDSLLTHLAWKQETIFLYGRWVKVPRLMCWYGDEGACYRYSGVNHGPLPWTAPLLAIKDKIESDYELSFNSVMANLYRNGSDSMGCHADDEKELGTNPVIASLTLGETRLIKFRHTKTKAVENIELRRGDLLIMAGEIQHHWRHELPKTKKPKKERINLTYRRVVL